MTLASLIEQSVTKFPEKPFIIERCLYRRKVFTYKDIYNRAQALISFFKEQSIKKGDKIILYLPNNPDYASLLWACALSGVIAVPLDFNSNTEFIEKIFNKIKAKQVFCSAIKQPNLKKIKLIESLDEIYNKPLSNIKKANIKDSDIFEIVYTSGTTSEPKGAIITQKNLSSNIESCKGITPRNMPNYKFLSILPLSHLFEQNVGFFLLVKYGSAIVYISSKKSSTIVETMQKEEITSLVTVPLFLQKIKEKIERTAEKQNKKEKLEKALEKFSKYPKIIKKIIFRSIRKKFPKVEIFFVGGAALDIETELFWNAIGIDVLQGYGLTETSPILTCNTLKHRKPGTVGKPLPGIEVKIKDNEIIAKGDNIFSGYFENDKETKKIIKNGYLYTGDIGEFDNDGFLKITGRKKNMILSPSGLNIYPEDIEKVLDNFPEIKESVVIGLDNDKKLVGVVLTNKKVYPSSLIKNANKKLSPHQYLSQISLWPDKDFPRTPTKKIIRRKVLAQLESKIKQPIQQTDDKIINLIANVCEINPSKIKELSKLVDLGLDSIKRIDLAVKVEEGLDLEFNEDLITQTTTVKDLRILINKNQEVKEESGLTRLNSKKLYPLRYVLRSIIFALERVFFSIKVKGIKNIPKENVIFIANHLSRLDTDIILRALPLKQRVNFHVAAAKDLFFDTKSRYGRIIGNIARVVYNAFSFSRTTQIQQSLKDFGEIINHDGNVLIYPEGTRSKSGKLGKFKNGIGLLTWHMQVPVVPIKIEGLYEILPWENKIPKKGKVTIKFGKPLTFSKLQNFEEITSTLRKAVENL